LKPVLSPASPPAGSPIPVHCGGPEHPDPDLVERFMRSELAGDDRRRIVRHLLTGCPRCVEITRRLWSLGDSPPASPARVAARLRK